MKKKKEKRGLAFRVDIEFLNLLFNLLKKRAYKLMPKDTQIHSISSEIMSWHSYTIIMKSKEFPIVGEDCTCPLGCFKIDREKKIIELKEIENINI